MHGSTFGDQFLYEATHLAPDPAAIAEHLGSVLKADCSGVAILPQDCGHLMLMTRLAGTSDTVPVTCAGTYCCYVKSTGTVLSVADHRRETRAKRCSFMAAEELVGFLGVPVFGCGSELVGCLSVMTKMPRIWSTPDIELAQKYARLVGHALLLTAVREERRSRRAFA